MDNHGPAVMFEIMANDQEKLVEFYSAVFGWQVTRDPEGFAYIPFPPRARPLLGGIGQAKPGVPGWAKGIAFYLLVDNVSDLTKKIKKHGGAIIVPRTKADGYHFAMFEDPECNLIGLVEPFPKTQKKSKN